jgi:hypothetical protein
MVWTVVVKKSDAMGVVHCDKGNALRWMQYSAMREERRGAERCEEVVQFDALQCDHLTIGRG